jgi:hypothetical protein
MVFLLPTHEAVNNLIQTAKLIGKTIKNAFVITEYLTENRTRREQIVSLKRYDYIFIDEVFQVKRDFIKTLYQAKVEFGIKIIAGGAFDQIKAIESDNIHYDLTKNHFFKNLFLDGVEVRLNYNKAHGRFTDDLDQDIKYIVETGQLPQHLSKNEANINHNFHLTVTKEMRNKCIKSCSVRSVMNNSDKNGLVYNGYGYHVGMELIADSTNKIYKFDKNYVKSREHFLLFKILKLWSCYSKLSEDEKKPEGYGVKVKNSYKKMLGLTHKIKRNKYILSLI